MFKFINLFQYPFPGIVRGKHDVNFKNVTMVFIGPKSRFNEFRDEFIKDTGITNVDENIGLYIQYVSARFADLNNRLMGEMTRDIQELYKVLKKV